MKATHLQQAGTIEETLLGNAVVPFTNDGEHHFSIKEIKPESQMPALFDNEIIISSSDTDHDIIQIQNSFLSIVLTAKIQLDDKFDKIDESYKDGLVLFVGLKSACGTYISMREIEELIGNQTAVLYIIPICFRVSIPLDDFLIFSTFTDYPNGLFGDLKIKFKINPYAFVFCQVNPIISMAKYYTMNKDELLGRSQQKLMDIDLMFRNWSLTFQYTKQFTQLGCSADIITGLHAELLTESGLKNLGCNIKPVTINIKNYVITEVTANMASYKATDACLNRVRQFYSQRPFVVPAQCVEMQELRHALKILAIRTCKQPPADVISQTSTDEFEDALTTPRNTATRRLNPHTDLTSFLITLQCERNSNGALTFDGLDTQNQNPSVELIGAPIYQGATDSYYNVDTSGKRPPPPILCTVHDTFWLFSPAAGGSCIYDTNHSFDEVIGPLAG
ncbi:MAG: hypothetical protein EZS28_004897 [Streblomastix strix]|uniref:Uncharacterized protein n=1 Tax=Streblomastix strix TaxID=222440 RepID=A0A5J4WZ00_9EUKA|nr:MAG: hypothetical protein EZS28_004897 [Streblomastix strix]